MLPIEEGKGISHGGLHAGGGHTGDIRPPGHSLVGASVLVAMTGKSSGTLPMREPTSGVEEGNVAEADEDWYQYACRIFEEIPNQNDPK